ncbi:MAG TPA: hypothetical protein VGQ83_27600 [Polyangia bacterium]|jgi:hypothetical protein
MDATEELEEEPGFDPEARRLCPDDTCTGLIGPDGKCKICGAVSPDGPPPAASAAPARAGAPEKPSGEPIGEPADEPAGDATAPSGEAAEYDPDERILCPDDTCTGLVGPDRKCKVCGTKYQP